MRSTRQTDAIMDASQSEHRVSIGTGLAPTLLRGCSRLWSTSRQRFLLPEVPFQVMGLSVFDENVPSRCPFSKLICDKDIPPSRQFSLAGNGMSMQCIGAVAAFTMVCSIPSKMPGESFPG